MLIAWGALGRTDGRGLALPSLDLKSLPFSLERKEMSVGRLAGWVRGHQGARGPDARSKGDDDDDDDDDGTLSLLESVSLPTGRRRAGGGA